MTIVSRADWRARPPAGTPKRMPTPSQRLWLHHTATEGWHGPAGVKATQDFHMNSRGYNDIAYSMLVDDDGTVYEGRGVGIVGAHTEGDNSKSHAICCMGDFTLRRPTEKMLQTIVDLAAHGHREGWWPNQITGGHRDAPGANTACPGGFLWESIPALNDAITAQLLGDDDMTPDQDARLRAVEAKLDRVINALAGYATDSAGHRRDGIAASPKELSLLGQIAAEHKIPR
jgi:hypothetical protein